MPASARKVFVSRKVVLPDYLGPACVLVEWGEIGKICLGPVPDIESGSYQVIDVGDDVIMPGVVDSHVHINEPGRTAWEGFLTATKAAAAGGITTVVDMPLNSIPPTISVDALAEKLAIAKGLCHVDVGFWGGLTPSNATNLDPLLKAGVAGFKCFLIHSGVDEFPKIGTSDLQLAFQSLQGKQCVLLFHAELEYDYKVTGPNHDYQTFLASRPDIMEEKAVELVCDLCLQYRVPCHIVHLSSAAAIPLIVKAKNAGAPLTVETCHHYLSLDAESIPDGATQYKCCPPVRSKKNQDFLWDALKSGHIDMVVSDHSPCTPDLKLLDRGDFLSAWGGISSLQLGLALFWTKAYDKGFTLPQIVQLLSQKPAQLIGLDNKKGALKPGHDADFVIWNPDESFLVKEDNLYHRNKVCPYIGKKLRGVVRMTVLRGEIIYNKGHFSPKALDGSGKEKKIYTLR